MFCVLKTLVIRKLPSFGSGGVPVGFLSLAFRHFIEVTSPLRLLFKWRRGGRSKGTGQIIFQGREKRRAKKIWPVATQGATLEATDTLTYFCDRKGEVTELPTGQEEERKPDGTPEVPHQFTDAPLGSWPGVVFAFKSKNDDRLGGSLREIEIWRALGKNKTVGKYPCYWKEKL